MICVQYLLGVRAARILRQCFRLSIVEGRSYERDGSAVNKWEPITVHYRVPLRTASLFAGKMIEESAKSMLHFTKEY